MRKMNDEVEAIKNVLRNKTCNNCTHLCKDKIDVHSCGGWEKNWDAEAIFIRAAAEEIKKNIDRGAMMLYEKNKSTKRTSSRDRKKSSSR
jgi:hypothetical protein